MVGPRDPVDPCLGSLQLVDPTQPALMSGDVVIRYGRGTCPICKTDRALNADGAVRPHRERTTA